MYQGKDETAKMTATEAQEAYGINTVNTPSPIQEATTGLDMALSQLEKTVYVLQERLSPVTYEKNIKVDGYAEATEMAADRESSPHRDQIKTLTSKVHSLRTRLETTMRDLEV